MKWLHEINSISDRISKVIARPKSATNADRISSEIIVVSFFVCNVYVSVLSC